MITLMVIIVVCSSWATYGALLMPRGSEPQRRRRAETVTPRASVRSRPTEALARPLDARPSEVPGHLLRRSLPCCKKPSSPSQRCRG
jgi:hypothetical protein